MLKKVALILALWPVTAIAQSVPQPSTAPSATSSAAPSPGAPDLSALSPAQQAALQAAIIKTSQNPVGNIAIVPFQNNFNYGVGPYTRYQYNLNVQPVVPFMLGKNLNLIARTIMPLVANPSFASRGSALRQDVRGPSAWATFRSSCSLRRKPNPER